MEDLIVSLGWNPTSASEAELGGSSELRKSPGRHSRGNTHLRDRVDSFHNYTWTAATIAA